MDLQYLRIQIQTSFRYSRKCFCNNLRSKDAIEFMLLSCINKASSDLLTENIKSNCRGYIKVLLNENYPTNKEKKSYINLPATSSVI